MLAETATEPFDSPEHLFEIKWDGIRALAFIDASKLRLQGRRLVEWQDRYPEFQGLAALPSGTIIDGEIVALHNGRPSFEKLQQRMHATQSSRIALFSKRSPVTFIAFDLPYFRGKSLLRSPLHERRTRLTEIFQETAIQNVIAADFVVEHGVKYFGAIEEAGLEGMMAKRLDSPYLPGTRSSQWLKIKVARVEVFDILGFTQRKGEPIISALVVGRHVGKTLVYKGNVGTGFSEAQRKEYFRELSQMATLKNPPQDGPKDAHWRKTGLRCRVRFFEETASGKLRGPVFEGFEV